MRGADRHGFSAGSVRSSAFRSCQPAQPSRFFQFAKDRLLYAPSAAPVN
jgi:hypothetical protein